MPSEHLVQLSSPHLMPSCNVDLALSAAAKLLDKKVDPGLFMIRSLFWLAGFLTIGTVESFARVGEEGFVVTPGPTVSASAFLDTTGIGAHWEQSDGVYGHHAAALANLVVRLGLRHVRGYDVRISPLLASRGITTMAVAGPEVGSADQVADLVIRANRHRHVIDAIEGPNEADLFWPLHGYSYHGLGFPLGTSAYQRDLYRTIRSRAELRNVVVIGPSLGRTYDPNAGNKNPFEAGSLADFVDFGNFHPYPFGGNSFSSPFRYDTISRYYWTGNFPSTNLDEFPYAFSVYGPPFHPKPMAATETGYPTWRNGISEQLQAKYVPRLFAEYCRLGIRRTYLYELADNMPDPTGSNMEDHFGLVRNDLTIKPAYRALQSLLELVSPRGSIDNAVAPPAIRLLAHLPIGFDRASFVHSLIIRVSTSKAVLLLWHEVAGSDTASSPPRTILVPVGSVELSLDPSWKATRVLDYDSEWRFRQTEAEAGEPATILPLRDQLVAVLLSPTSAVREHDETRK